MPMNREAAAHIYEQWEQLTVEHPLQWVAAAPEGLLHTVGDFPSVAEEVEQLGYGDDDIVYAFVLPSLQVDE